MTDTVRFLKANNNNNQFDEAFNFINGNKKLNKFKKFMRENNDDGVYNEILDVLETKPDANLTDLVKMTNKDSQKY